MPKKRALVVLGSLCIALILALAILFRPILTEWFVGRPPYPQEWNRVKQGMTCQEAMAIVGPGGEDNSEKNAVFWDVKGKSKWDCFWQLRVGYDNNGLVYSVEASYWSNNCGWFNKSFLLAGSMNYPASTQP